MPTAELARLRELEADAGARIERIERAAEATIRAARAEVEEAKDKIGGLLFTAAFDAARNAGRVTELDRDALRALFMTDEAAAMAAMETEWERAL